MANNLIGFDFYEKLLKKASIESRNKELEDLVMLSMDFDSKIASITQKAHQYNPRAHMLKDGLLNKVYMAASKFYKTLRGIKRESLIEEYEEIANDSAELPSSFDNLLAVYETNISKLDGFYKQKDADILDYAAMKDEFLLENCKYNGLLNEVVAKLDCIKTHDGLSKDEIKYSDAKAKIEFKIRCNESNIALLMKLIKQKREIKDKLAREKEQQNEILCTYQDISLSCKKEVESLRAAITDKLSAN